MIDRSKLDPAEVQRCVVWAENRLGDIRDFSRKERKQAYAELRDEQLKAFEKQNYTIARKKNALKVLDAALEDIEQPFAGSTSFVDRTTGFLSDFWKQTSPTLKMIGGGFALLGDFFKPILELTQITVVVAGAAALLLGVLSTRAIEWSAGLRKTAAMFGVLCTCSAGLWGIQTIVPAGKQQGAIAAVVPGASVLQDKLFASLDRIEDAARGGKREVSADPRKELFNLGMKFDEADFMKAYFMCDKRAISLYKQSGMRIPHYKAIEFITNADHIECIREFKDDFVAIGPDICFTDKYMNPIFRLRTAPVDWLSKGFEKPERKAFIEELCGEARLRAEMPSLYRGRGGQTAAPVAPAPPAPAPAKPEPKSVWDTRPVEPAAAAPAAPAPNAFAVTPPAAQADAATIRANSALSAAEVRGQILGTKRTVSHNGQLDLTYSPDGTFSGGDGRSGTTGTYRIEQDGRVCWKNNRGFSGCFQYYRQNGGLFVRRNDGTSRDIIGAVKVSSRQ